MQVAATQNAVTLIDVIGYCPQRDEFDPDYDMDAEIPLADLEFAEGDDAVDESKALVLGLHLFIISFFAYSQF